MLPDRGSSSPRLFVRPGARVTENALFEDLDARIDEIRGDARRLARPVRVVVPSRSLRLHVTARLVRRRGRALAGVLVQTHFAVALEILERIRLPVPRGRFLFEPLPRRFARDERTLREPLERLDDGFAAVAATVRDLLDAGFEPALAPGLDEALAAEGRAVATGPQVERARALVRVTLRSWEEMDRYGVGHGSRLLDLAARAVRDHGAGALPADGVFVHGFSDATGRVTDLLEALQRVCGARVYLDRPPDPGEPSTKPLRLRPDPSGEAFGARFVERMQLAAAPESSDAPAPEPPDVDAFTARGTEAEVGEAARRIRALLDDGVEPHRVGLVARDVTPYRRDVRRTLTRRGVPFSGVGERGSITPAGRRSEAILDLLRRREETAADRFLDALAFVPRRSDLRLALYALGTGRLRDLAELDVGAVVRNGRYALPLRQGFYGGPTEGNGTGDDDATDDEIRPVRSSRRSIPRDTLERLVERARRTRAQLADWPREAPVDGHLHRLGRLVVDALGWKPRESDLQPLRTARDRLSAEAPRELDVSLDELLPLLARAAEPETCDPLGGEGGGVAVLSVTEARGRTFDHLFVLGLNRDVFPRTVREDPLLPDGLRAQLRDLLPDLPVKASGHDEERYLFDQLLSSAPRVTLSWQTADEDGQTRAPSPLVDRVRRAPHGPISNVPEAPSPWSLDPADSVDPTDRPVRSAAEHAVLAALHAPPDRARRDFARLFPLAVQASRDALGLPGEAFGLDPLAVASARLRILDELDPNLATPEGRKTRARLGPFYGFLGAVGDAADPRHERLSATLLERLAVCPWQVFLERILGIEPTPDPLTLPGVDPRLLGIMVHEVLDTLVRRADPDPPESLEEARARSPVSVPWPDPDDLEEILQGAATRVLASEGLHLPGFVRVLVEQARPYLDVAREMDWVRGAALSVLGSEVTGRLTVEDARGRPRAVRFRTDRTDTTQEGLVLTDYKTGKPFTAHKREDTRRRKMLEEVAAGRRLQAAAYALAAGPHGRGRYLFLAPDVDDEHRIAAVDSSDADVLDAFRSTARTVLDVWDQGLLFPRLLEPDGKLTPQACKWCAVRQACLQGDSGAGLRQFEVLDRGEDRTPVLQAAWTLPRGDVASDEPDDGGQGDG